MAGDTRTGRARQGDAMETWSESPDGAGIEKPPGDTPEHGRNLPCTSLVASVTTLLTSSTRKAYRSHAVYTRWPTAGYAPEE